MKNFKSVFLLSIVMLVLSSCSSTFGGSVVVFRFADFVYYVIIALIMGCLCASMSKKENRLKQFWIWFIASLVVTPLAGLICFIVLLTRFVKSK